MGCILNIKLDNILVDYGDGDQNIRFTDVQISDCGDTSHIDAPQATQRAIIGAGIFRSPKAMLNMPWGTATDIWSFGTSVSLQQLIPNAKTKGHF